jgi:DNA-binding response OmpR family regulator
MEQPSEAQGVLLRSVLVVDDDKAIRHLVATILRKNGFSVETAQNGAEAIHAIDAAAFSAIVLDLMMPIVDGFEVIEHMQRTAPARLASCVVVLSAASERDLRKLDGVSLFRVIRKPFELIELVAVVTACVDGDVSTPAIS